MKHMGSLLVLWLILLAALVVWGAFPPGAAVRGARMAEKLDNNGISIQRTETATLSRTPSGVEVDKPTQKPPTRTPTATPTLPPLDYHFYLPVTAREGSWVQQFLQRLLFPDR